MNEERLQQIGTPLQPAKFLRDSFAEIVEIPWNEIGQSAVFHISPNVINRIQLRGIGRERLYDNLSVFVQIRHYRTCVMNRDLIPHNCDWFANLPAQEIEKRHQRISSKVRVVLGEKKVEAKSPLLWADGDCTPRLRRMIGRMSVRELTEDERARERVG